LIDSYSNAPDVPRRPAGVIGLGQMGRGIARNLDRAGLLRAAFDIDREAVDRAGLSDDVERLSLAEMGAACGVVLFVVPASPQIEACLGGPDGLLARRNDGQLLIDLTTSHPGDTLRLAKTAAQADRIYIDGGMTGGAAGADAGTLTLMLGGDEDAIERARPVLERIAAKTFHVGASGAGHTLKLVHNMILHTIFLVTCEGCRVAERAGIDLAKAIEVFNAGNARSFVTEVRFPKHILSGAFDGRSTVANLAKDLGMAASYAEGMGAPALYGPLTAALLQRAVDGGMAGEDFTRLYLRIDGLLEAEAAARSQPVSSPHEAQRNAGIGED
jgi:3-hydroxyisobutyrate dehydrogenase